MVSTVTTTVVSTITGSAEQLISSLGLAAVLTLIACLVVRELASAAESERWQRLGRNLSLPILALLFVFVFVVAAKVLQALA